MAQSAEIESADRIKTAKDTNGDSGTTAAGQLLAEVDQTRRNEGNSQEDMSALSTELHNQGILPGVTFVDSTDVASGTDNIQIQVGDNPNTVEAQIHAENNSLTYTDANNVEHTIDLSTNNDSVTNGNVTTTLDSSGNMVSQTVAQGNETPRTYVYGQNGQITEINGQLNDGTSYSINAQNAMTEGRGGINLVTAKVNEDGSFTYTNGSGQVITENPDGTARVAASADPEARQFNLNPQDQGASYTVAAGDTLWSVAQDVLKQQNPGAPLNDQDIYKTVLEIGRATLGHEPTQEELDNLTIDQGLVVPVPLVAAV